MYFHHTIEYPDGTVFEGKLDHRPNIELFGLYENCFEGLSVLDIATNDGFFAFWAEQFGKSTDVVAIDVGNYADYEWGPGGPPDEIKDLAQQDKNEVFKFHHNNLESRITHRDKSIYDIGGFPPFDVIFNFGLLYHLRNPIKALDICRTVCKGIMFLETQVFPFAPHVPMYMDCGQYTGLLGITDNNWPTESCVASWLCKADFLHVFIQKPDSMTSQTRQRFIACVSPEWADHIADNDNFFPADNTYWDEVQAQTLAYFKQR